MARLQADGLVVLVEGDHGIHAQLARIGEQVAIEAYALFVHTALDATGHDARPAHGGVEGGPPHLGEELEVLAPAVVEVRRHVVGVVHIVKELVACAIRQVIERPHHAARAVGVAVVHGTPTGAHGGTGVVKLHGSFAALVPTSLHLLCRDGAAPEEAFRECHDGTFLNEKPDCVVGRSRTSVDVRLQERKGEFTLHPPRQLLPS